MKRYFLMFRMIFVIGLIGIFFLIPISVKAQVLPCNGGDPTQDCPIDLNVWFLVAGVIILGLVLIIRKNSKLLLQLKTTVSHLR